jgi:hypothetical protein
MEESSSAEVMQWGIFPHSTLRHQPVIRVLPMTDFRLRAANAEAKLRPAVCTIAHTTYTIPRHLPVEKMNRRIKLWLGGGGELLKTWVHFMKENDSLQPLAFVAFFLYDCKHMKDRARNLYIHILVPHASRPRCLTNKQHTSRKHTKYSINNAVHTSRKEAENYHCC